MAFFTFATKYLVRKIANDELGRPGVNEYAAMIKLPVVVVLDNIRSAYNVGSVFRTCDAFLVSKIILCGITAQPPHRDIKKTALGATESVPWEYTGNATDAVSGLRWKGYRILAVEQAEGAVMLDQFDPLSEKKYALIFGHEVKGVSDGVMESVDGAIEIPQGGTKHSLNVAVSAGAVLWEVYKKMAIGSKP